MFQADTDSTDFVSTREEKPREEQNEAQDDKRKRNSLMRAPNMRHGRLHMSPESEPPGWIRVDHTAARYWEGKIRGGGKRMGQERFRDEARESLWRDQGRSR